jgi:two-component system sensor histidine kinase CiaH
MFNKLRNHMLFINMVIISALLFITFTAVFLSSYHNSRRMINERLNSSLSFVNPQGDRFRKNKPQDPNNEPFKETPPNDTQHNNPHFLSSFSVTVDSDGNIVSVRAPYDLSDKTYEDYIEKIIQNPKGTGSIKYLESTWEYKCVPYDNGYAIAFTESEQQISFLRNLALILILVWFAALIFAFLISFYSANRSIKPIEDSYNKQKQFIADASHELKTPLTAINTNIDVLLSHGESTINEEKKWLSYIKSEAERMTKLTNELLYLARLDYDQNNMLYEKTSFSDAAEGVILTMEAVIYENKIKFSYNIEPDIFVLSSSELLKQLVMILLDNAIKYTPENGSIYLECKKRGQEAILTVKNTGEGISADDLTQIFERFYRTDKSRSRDSGGYGLGLAIAQSIAKSAKGSISVSSKPNEYTEFTVKLPLLSRQERNMA